MKPEILPEDVALMFVVGPYVDLLVLIPLSFEFSTYWPNVHLRNWTHEETCGQMEEELNSDTYKYG